MRWHQIAPKLEWDGSLRDARVMATTRRHWQIVLDSLRRSQPSPSFYVDGDARETPQTIEEIFRIQRSASTQLALDLGGMRLNCHFFRDEEIEFDVDPQEIKGPADLRSSFRLHELPGRRTREARQSDP